MALYDGYTTVSLTGVLNLGLQTSTGATVTDPGALPADDPNILGDTPGDTFQGPASLFGTTYTFGGVVYDADLNPVGFVGIQVPPIGPVLNTTFVISGTDPSTLSLTLLPTDITDAGSQWDLVAGAPVCFMAGTMIMTTQGEVCVEALKAGDLVLTSDGREAPVRWIGICTVLRRFADPFKALPIQIRAGALDENVPSRDLYLSPDHAVLLDGHLVHAGALVNGVSVVRDVSAPEEFKYYHVELEDHSLILASGVAAETFVDNVTRMRFDNWEEHVELFGETLSIPEMDLPRAKSARQVPEALRRRIQKRSADMIANDRQAAAAA